MFDIAIRDGRRVLVDVAGFPLAPKQISILFGESGIGKSLIGKALFGMADTEALHVRVNGEGYAEYRSRPQSVEWRRDGFFVFQEPSTHFNPLLTLNEQIREGDLEGAPSHLGVIQELWPDKDVLPLSAILKIYPSPFRPSGGEKQRILAGMAFEKMDLTAADQRRSGGLFVFDEPTGSLDREARNRFLDRLILRYRRSRVTVLLITHDYSMIGYLRQRHADLGTALHFLELARRDGGQQVSVFSPKRYFAWIESRRPSPSHPTPPFLTVESGLSVFGKTYRFTRHGERADLQVGSGELVYLKAGSGIGKTTVVKIVMGLQKAERFRMVIGGVRLGEVSPLRYWKHSLWGKKVTMAFQHADEALNPHATVEDSLAILPAATVKTRDQRVHVLSLLFDAHSVSGVMAKKVWQLSGGQKQRLNLLRAFALSTPLTILDEPLNALDFESIGRVITLIEEEQRSGHGILLISHNEDIFDTIVPPERVYQLEVAGQ
ncbi:MAG: ATP-binding cassette domain-containing protein [Bacteroidota bacterium]